MAYIRKTKTGSGRTAVQICWKRHGEIVKVEHIGSAETVEGVKKLEKKARERLAEGQGTLFDLSGFDAV